ncbi:MAG: hypothetical protein HY299_00845 [Verrucomicrobia bacterium]|nr:hypothetical protein [Verrucomicrobiota bacterium]
MTGEHSKPTSSLSHEAWWPSDLFVQGIGWVILTRFKSGGRRAETGVFLVDVYCLGAKMAVYEDGSTEGYVSRIRDHYLSEFPMTPADPCCARKLVEQAVRYAQDLGFAPHLDYKKAARVWGGIDPGQCRQVFTFGYAGKPLYRRGPNETEVKALSIVRQLERRCGQGGFDYVIQLDMAKVREMMK